MALFSFLLFLFVRRAFNSQAISLDFLNLRIQKMMLDPLELELLAAVSHLTWVLGTELGSSRSSLNH